MGETRPEELSGQVGEKISLESLSHLTGFPVEFIKKELLLTEEELPLVGLRESVAQYLMNARQDAMN